MPRKPPAPGQRRSGGGLITDRLRVAVDRALGEMDRRGRPIHIAIADGFEKDPAKMLSAIRGLLPQEVSHTVMDVTALHLQAVRELSKAYALPSPSETPMPVIIDVEPEDAEDLVAVNGDDEGADEDADEG